jgi:hypothetical protein
MKGQRAHPGAEAIADCMGGARTWRARRVAAHIAACPSCSAMERQFGQVSAVLAAVPQPPLPGEVALRLDAALAAEVAARAASGSVLSEDAVPVPSGPVPSGPVPSGPVPSGPVPSGPVPSGPAAAPPVAVPAGPVEPEGQPRRRPPTQPRAWRVPMPAPVLAALALCLVLAGGGYLISQSGGTSTAPTSASAGSAAASQPRHTSAAVGRPAIISGPSGTASTASYSVRFTNTDYLPATLRALALSERTSPGLSAGTPPSGALQGCVLEVAGNDRVDVVDLARYQGRPATIIIARDRAWVTARGCNATQHHVLYSVSLSGG